MYKKYLNLYNILLIGLLFLTLGIFLFILNNSFLSLIILLISILLLLQGISNIIKFFSKKEKKTLIIKSLINIIISSIFIFIPNIPLGLFSIIFGSYMLFNSLVNFINYIILKKNKIHGKILEITAFLFYFSFGLSCIIIPLTRINTILIIIGIYFILIGISYIYDFIKQIIPTKNKEKMKKKIRLPLPVLFNVLIPHSILQDINKKKIDEKLLNSKKNDENADLEIFIHVTNSGFGVTGHADLYFENKVYSYGNYDPSSIKLFESIGDGVLFTVKNKKKYINFCIKDSKKTIFAFGIKLTEKQKNKLRKRFDELMSNTIKWNKPIIDVKNKENKNYYAMRLYKETKATFYKFKSGKFKTYFVLCTNCVLLVDYITKITGTDIIKINGIITPGTYYDFLATEFSKKKSNVVSYNVYK